MTEITIKGHYDIEIKGHSPDKRVCSGISTLTAALDGWLTNNTNEHLYTEGDGYAKITAPESAKTAVEMFTIGVLRIEKSFPDIVRVTYISD
nr:MAG TPA: YsxB-like protein [Caudoviricetes sp.]